MSNRQADDIEEMTALAADALVDMRTRQVMTAAEPQEKIQEAETALCTPAVSLQEQEEDAFSIPLFTDEEERREKQQLSPHEIRDIESDLRGITAHMDAMSIAGGDGGVAGGSSSVGAAPLNGHEVGAEPSGPDVKQQPSTWRKPHEIHRDLNLINEEIARLPAAEKVAYLEAKQRCPGEVFGGWRWDAFLGERDFDAKRTGKNLVLYWKKRLATFGDDRCFLPMTLAGAMQDEVAGMMAYDPHRISPVKDTAGRTVMVVTPSRRVKSLYSSKSSSRAWWYVLEVIAQDPEARRCGVVMIADGINTSPGHFDPRFVTFAASIMDLFPMPWRAMHLVNVNTFVSRVFIPAAKFLMSRQRRHRIIVHTGTISNTIEEMRTYALPPNRLPQDIGGEVVIDMQAWIYGRYAKEVLNLAGPGPNMEQNVEPSIKRMRMEESADASEGDRQSQIQEPESKREALSLSSISEIQLTEEESTLLGHNMGRSADPRMSNAVILKLRNPEMDNADILIAAGFNYPLPEAVESKRSPLASSVAQHVSDGPATKRLHSEHGEETPAAPVLLAPASTRKSEERQNSKVRGKKSDPRMSRAIEIKKANPDLPLYDALIAGGFVFRQDTELDDMVDTDGIALKQRKNNLCRRLRIERQKEAKVGDVESAIAKTSR